MGKNRKFYRIDFTPRDECEHCDRLKDCIKNDISITSEGILIDCEGFYYVFKKLEAFERLTRFDGDVEKYKQDISEYEKIHKGTPWLTPPLIVNGTLAAELALKFLIFKEKGEYECGHNLRSLFNQLTEPHKTVLLNRIYKELHQDENTLETNLQNSSNLFEKFRYFFENDAIGYSGFLNEFIHLVCDYAISFKDEYEEL